MAEDEVTGISETDSQKADSDCWDIIKRKLDESGLILFLNKTLQIISVI